VPRKRLQLLAVATLMLLVAAACGQKPGVSEQVALTGGGGTAAGLPVESLPEGATIVDGQVVSADGEVLGSAEDFGLDPTTGQATGGGTTTGGTAAPGGGGEDAPGGGEDAPGGGEEPTTGTTTGVTGDTIKIGLHAPITGAAPVPSQSFSKGKDLYWNYIGDAINGRKVETVFRNDNYNPSQAVAGCREMVENDKVFLLVGIAGTDQIQACARYAASVGVPYISAGVTEQVVNTLPNYFAIWMSYPAQGPLLADLLATKLGATDEKNGMLRFNTPTFEDGHQGFVEGMQKVGASLDYDRAISKNAGQSDATTIAAELNQQGIENVHVLVSPTFFIQLANAAARQNYFPQWVGYGLTKGIDTVANVACANSQSIQNARFLSPFPAYADSNRFDPDFRKAGGTDDIMFGLWGASKVVGEMLKAPGKNLTRERFVYFGERLQNLKTGVFPPVTFSPTDHFGGSQMHLLRADCSKRAFVTEQAFVSDF
jgi:branched-chain amino acid transport system substrate-binding protein